MTNTEKKEQEEAIDQEDEQPILVTKNDGILTLTINRPDRMNALDRRTLHIGAELIDRIHYEKDIRVVIVTGAGIAIAGVCSLISLVSRSIVC